MKFPRWLNAIDLLCKLPKTSSLCNILSQRVILSGVWRDSQGIAQESDNPHAVEFLFCGAAKQKREHRERDLAWNFDGFCSKCNSLHEDYWLSFADPAAANALRFCSFAALHLAKVRLRKYATAIFSPLRMTR